MSEKEKDGLIDTSKNATQLGNTQHRENIYPSNCVAMLDQRGSYSVDILNKRIHFTNQTERRVG